MVRLLRRAALIAAPLFLLTILGEPQLVHAQKASGSSMIDGSRIQEIANIARGFGTADIDKDARRDKATPRDPAISGRIEGLKYSVLFSGCDGGRSCRYIQLIASFERPSSFGDREMNDWNKKKLFGKAFINDNGDAIISMNTVLHGGISRANIEHTFEQWRVFLRDFNEYLYKKKG